MTKLTANTSTGTLKILALVFMFCDHAGKMLLPLVPEMRIIGRIAFPLYCWCLVVGAHHTRSFARYALRIALVGLISQPLYMAALNHTWREPNIFLTLLLGLCALWGMRERKLGSHIWAPAAALVLAVVLKADYGWKGVLLIIALWTVRDSRAGIAAVMTLMCLYWGTTSSAVTEFFGLSLRPLTAYPIGTVLGPLLRTQALAILALPLMLIRMPNLRLPAWAGYAMYPAHLVLLWVLERV